MGIFDHRFNSSLLHEHIWDEYDHNGSDYWSDYCSDCWQGTGHASSNAKLYGRPLDFITPSRSCFLRVLPFGRLWYDTPDNAIGFAMHSSRSHDAVIRVYDDAGNVIEMHEHKGDFKECS